jgi:protein-L-isoaspartate(D-aspartate) O-methyltransferase
MPDHSEAVERAFEAAPREGFLPAKQRRWAGVDRALAIGYGQTNSQPTTVRNMLRYLDVRPGLRVLDVGCGSGWSTALLGYLVGSTGTVVATEIVPELVDFARANLFAHDLGWVEVVEAGPEVLGLPERAPYDRILVSAEARTLPGQLVEQLAPGGVMVLPVAGRLTEVRRTPDGTVEVIERGAYAFVPLVGG